VRARLRRQVIVMPFRRSEPGNAFENDQADAGDLIVLPLARVGACGRAMSSGTTATAEQAIMVRWTTALQRRFRPLVHYTNGY
jgi:hypothetical protein